MQIAYFFGTTNEISTYIIASSIPQLFLGLISGGISFSFIPYLLRFSKSNNQRLIKFINIFNYIKFKLVLFAIAISSIFLFIFTIYTSQLVSADFIIIYILFWTLFIFSTLISIINSFFNAEGSHLFNQSLNLLPPLFSLLSVYLLHKYLGVKSIVLGMLLGIILVYVIIFFRFHFKKIVVQNSKLELLIYNDRSYLKSFAVSIIAMTTFSMFQVVDNFWLIKFGKDFIPHFSYLQRIIIAIGGIIIAGPSIVLLPDLSIYLEKADFISFYEKIRESLFSYFSISIFFVLIFLTSSNQILKLLFLRGKFTASDIELIIRLLPFYLFGMIFMIGVVIMFRISFLVINKIRFFLIFGLINFVGYNIFCFLFIHIFGYIGIPVSYLIFWLILYFSMMSILFRGYIFLIFNYKSLFFVIKNLILFVITFILVTFFKVDNVKFDSLIITIIYNSLLVFLIYLIILKNLIKINELDSFLKFFSNFKSKSKMP